MAGSRRQWSDDMIERLLECDSDEDEFVGGVDSDAEPDEIIQDFLDEETSSEEDEILDNLPERTSDFRKVLDVPKRMYGSYRYKWNGEAPQSSGRTPRRNFILHPPGNKARAKQISTPLEAWSLFFDDESIHNVKNKKTIGKTTTKMIALQVLGHRTLGTLPLLK